MSPFNMDPPTNYPKYIYHEPLDDIFDITLMENEYKNKIKEQKIIYSIFIIIIFSLFIYKLLYLY
jgi:hypothetical protein